MALYIPATRRRRHLLVAVVIALVVGAGVGVIVGRLTVPSVDDRISSVQADARDTSAGLRVLALHEQAGVKTSASNEVDLVLKRTRKELSTEFGKAPWLSSASKKALLDHLDALGAITDRSSTAFGSAADSLASEIDATFGAS